MEKKIPESNYFRSCRFSFFGKLQHQDAHHMRLHRFEESMYDDDANFSAATVLLQGGNLGDAWEFIEFALAKNPNSVHAWCNKGVYHLMRIPQQEEKANEAERKVHKLLEKEGPRKTAALEYAYWQFMMVQTEKSKEEKSRKEALKLFGENMNGVEGLKLEHHFLHLKMLATMTRSCRNKNDEYTIEVLKKLLKECEILVSSGKPDFEVEAWTNLAKAQENWNCPNLATYCSAELLNFQKVASTTEYQPIACANKMLQIISGDPEFKVRSNFYATIGKIYLHSAKDYRRSVDEKWQMLETALEFGEKYLECQSSRYNIGPKVSLQVLLHMWAIKYYQQHQQEVEAEFRRICSWKGEKEKMIREQDVLRFLEEEFYVDKSDQTAETRALLERAEGHVERLRKDSSHLFFPSYALVKLHLRKPLQEIEEAFPRSEDFESDREKALLWANKGRFMEMISRYEEARENYRAVIDLHNQSAPHPKSYWMADSGLSRVNNIVE